MVDLRKILIPPPISRPPLGEEEARSQQKFNPWNFNVEGQNFEFAQGRILLNGQDLAKHLGENIRHLSSDYW